MQGMERATMAAAPAEPQQRKPVVVDSYLWEGMKEKFLKGEPKVLGAVQIVVGLLHLSMGIIMICSTLNLYGQKPFSVYTGYPVWGSVMFIISGSFSVAATRRTTKGLVQASLGLNITSSVFSGVGMILLLLSLILHGNYAFICYYYNDSKHCILRESVFRGLDGVMFFLSVLEFCIAVSLSSFGCKATCCYTGGIVLVLPSDPHKAEAASAAALGGFLAPAAPEESAPGHVP